MLIALVIMAAGGTTIFLINVPARDAARTDSEDKATIGAETAPELLPPFSDWPEEKPDLALVLTGEMLGYLRPCGCSAGQHGGLARRGGLLEFLRDEKGWQTLPVDLGDLIGKEGPLGMGGPFEELRYETAIESMKALGYQVVGVGLKDLNITALLVTGQAINSEPMRLINANVREKKEDDGHDVLDGFFNEFIVGSGTLEAGGLKVAVGAVTADSLAEENFDQTVVITPTDKAVEDLLAHMKEADADLKVLLAHMSEDDAQALAQRHPGFDLVLCRSRFEDSATSEATMIGDTMVTWVGRKGKSVGVVGFWKDRQPRLRFELVALDERFGESAAMNAIYAGFVDSIRQRDFLAEIPKTALEDGNAYVGAAKCSQCHVKAYEKWKTTKHSRATEALVNAPIPGQQFNPECIVCHVTGVNHETGFRSIEETPLLTGNQCENCHGPGKLHAEDPRNAAKVLPMKRSRLNVKTRCMECHDAENDIHFDFDECWPKVEHPWKDYLDSTNWKRPSK